MGLKLAGQNHYSLFPPPVFSGSAFLAWMNEPGSVFKFPKGMDCKGAPKGRAGPPEKEPQGFRVQVSGKNVLSTWQLSCASPQWEFASRSSVEAGLLVEALPSHVGVACPLRDCFRVSAPHHANQRPGGWGALNYLHDSACKAKVLTSFLSAVQYCIHGNRHFSKVCFGISIEVTLPSCRRAFVEVRPFPAKPYSEASGLLPREGSTITP